MDAKINLTPPEPALDAAHLDKLIVLWVEHAFATRAVPTARNYMYKIRYFQDWWRREGPQHNWQLRRRDLEAFDYYLTHDARTHLDRPLAFNTRHDVLRRLRQMFTWAQAEGYITSLDCRTWVPYTEGEEPRRKAVSMVALEQLFAVADTSVYPDRDRAILAVLIGTGIRRAECASIQIEQMRIDPDRSGILKVQGKRTRANWSGLRDVAFDAATGGFVRAHLAVSGDVRGPLFRTERGTGLTPQGIYKVVKRCIWAAHLEGIIQGCHDLRRAFATHFVKRFRSPVHADILRRQMGHASYRTTAMYTLWEPEDYQHDIISPVTLLAKNG